MTIKIYWMSCADCAMLRPMQPCEACPNYNSRPVKEYRVIVYNGL